MTDVSSQPPAEDDERDVLTTRQGHPVYDNQNQRTIGDRGPATLENYQFLEKISHFDRERIPERVVHARGTTAFGFFEAYGTWGDEPIAKHTRAKLFQEAGKRTDVALRFSTVAGGRDSSEAVRDPRGFAVKFYTEDGNWAWSATTSASSSSATRSSSPTSSTPRSRTRSRSSARSPTASSTSSARRPRPCTWSCSCSARAAFPPATARCRASA
jgi:hypothetical protein